jgi:hypothetical protein
VKLNFTLAIILFCGAVNLKAQITISKTDMPQPGDTIRLSTDNTNAGLPSPTLTGPSYTWDYTKLLPYTQTIDTFLSVSSTPFAYQLFFNDVFLYPKYLATVAQSAPNLPALGPVTITGVDNFYKATSSDYESVGYGANINSIPTSVKDDTIDYMYLFPMNYGNADSCYSSNHVNIPSIAYYGVHQYRVNHVDGWGTLKTPYGTYNTLRITTQLYVTDSIYISAFSFGFAVPQPEQIQYKWFGIGSKVPLLQVNESVVLNNPVFTSAVYRDSARRPVLGVAQVDESSYDVRVYPNPSNGLFTIQIANNYNSQIDVYNMLGEQVYSSKQATTSTLIDLTGKSKGVYFYRVKTEAGSLISQGKLVLQ